MNFSLLAEIRDFLLFLKAVAEVGFFTGLGAAALIAFGYELTMKLILKRSN